MSANGHEPQRIHIPLDGRGLPVISAALKAQIAPLLNLDALNKALAKAAQSAIGQEATE